MAPRYLLCVVLWEHPTGRGPKDKSSTCCRDYVIQLVWERLHVTPEVLRAVDVDSEVWLSLPPLRFVPR